MSTTFASGAFANGAPSTATLIPFPAQRPSGQHLPDARRAESAPKTRLHLTRRGRVVLTTLAAIPLVVGAALLAINGGGAAASGPGVSGSDVSFSHVTVSSGQSLWQIAEKIAPTADPRDVVAAIVDLNQLPNSTVMPGQRLAIPTEYAP